MAIALVQAKSSALVNDTFGTVNSVATAYTSNVTAGNLLVVVGYLTTPKTMRGTVTDSQGNTWTAATSAVVSADSADTSCQIFWAAAGSSAANTVTWTTDSHNSDNSSNYYCRLFEFSGCDTTTPVDAASTVSPASSGISLSLTVSSSNTLILASAVNTSGNGDITPQASYTAGPTPRSQRFYDNTEYRVDAPAGANVVKFDNGFSYNGLLAGVAFKPASGGGGASVKRLLVLGAG